MDEWMLQPWETGGEFAALTEVILNSLRPPAEVICGRTEGASVLGRTGTAAARQAVHPGEKVLLEPPQQLQHQEVFDSKFTFCRREEEIYWSFYISIPTSQFICGTRCTAKRKHESSSRLDQLL